MQVRWATSEDALAVETVRITGWQAAYRGIVADSFLDSLVVDARMRASRIAEIPTLVAVDADQVVGMACFGPSRDEDLEGVAELYALYVDPSSWRAGIGSALLEECTELAGVAALWVLEGNHRARAFYGRHGFTADGATKELDLEGPVTEIRMRRGLDG